MGNKSKIVLTAVITAVITAVVSVNLTNFINNSFGAFLPTNGVATSLSKKIGTVDYFLKNEYLYDYKKTSDMVEAAVQGYVESLDEPYTHYYTRKEFSDYLENIEDGYQGIGMVVSVTEDDEIIIISTFEDSPAFKAGLMPGDILTKVDGKAYSGKELTEAVNYIKKGELNTDVTLTLRRDEEVLDITVTRSNIEMKSVDGVLLDNGIGHIQISGFNVADEGSEGHDTYTEFKAVVEELEAKGMKKMIIDLRDNPGGELSVVCNVADMLLGEGTITYMEYKDGTRETYSSDAQELDMPMVVLINGNSASASEVLTGALKDYSKATVIGTKSYGKGVVQTVIPFADGSGMSLTVANYFSPKGVCIQDIGIEPDIEVKLDEKYDNYYASMVPSEDDLQLKKAIEVLNEK